MPAAPRSPNEQRRLAAVRKVNLMGTPAEDRFDKITCLAAEMFDMPLAALDLVGEQMAWMKSVHGFDAIEVPRKDSYCHHTVLDSDVCVIRDARADPRLCDNVFADSWVFYAGVPLCFDQERVGVLCVGDSKPREMNADQIRELRELAGLAERELNAIKLSQCQTALGTSGEELGMKARIDVLTHAWNKDAIAQLLVMECRIQTGGTAPLVGVLMIEIDDFGAIVEHHGREGADQVLRTIASRLRALLRPMDSLGRYAQHQFLAVLPDLADHNDALRLGESIRESICALPVALNAGAVTITCSLGCAAGRGGEDCSRLIRQADQALFSAVAYGGNRFEYQI